MVISKKYIFLLVNFLMLAGIMLSVTDFPLASNLTKVKILFILYCFLDTLGHRRRVCGKNTLFIFLILGIYVMAWGFVFTNPTVAFETRAHTATMILFVAMLFFGTVEVTYYQCVEEYVVTSGAAVILVLAVQVFRNFDQWILNPFFAVRSFFAHDVVRASFGFTHSNVVGCSCFVAVSILMMVYVYYSHNDLFHSRSKLIIVVLQLFLIYILLTASSRTAGISIALFAAGMAAIELWRRVNLTPASVHSLKKIIAAGSLLLFALFSVLDVWGYIWDNSNRALNVSENLHWVPVIGSIWTGMGFVENGAFITSEATNWISSFGVATSSVDMNYLYLYCTTGILGCVLIALVLITIGIGIYRKRKQKYGSYYLLLYFLMLFYAVWETILFTYHFWALMVPHIILLYGANEEKSG